MEVNDTGGLVCLGHEEGSKIGHEHTHAGPYVIHSLIISINSGSEGFQQGN
jgi:hypothetical protein